VATANLSPTPSVSGTKTATPRWSFADLRRVMETAEIIVLIALALNFCSVPVPVAADPL
jgi:hypothetical protein